MAFETKSPWFTRGLIVFVLLLSLYGTAQEKSFSFVFMTDIHIQPELNATKGFRQAIDHINGLKPDFVITGGDLVMDALGQHFPRADSLYNLYLRSLKALKMPVYNTMGNHENFAVYRSAGRDTLDTRAGTGLFEERIGKTYYTFIHKGWKFFVLNSVQLTPERTYEGGISATQMDWIRKELMTTDPAMPIVIITHIPFLTVFYQVLYGSLKPNDPGLVVKNSKEVLDLFNGHNLKAVLQGHLHYFEDIYVKGIHFITGGSIAGAWWKGPYEGTREGYVLIRVKGDSISGEYIDYGWEVN